MVCNKDVLVKREDLSLSVEQEEKSDKMISPLAMGIGGLFLTLIGAVFYYQPASPLSQPLKPDFLMIIGYFGILMMMQGMLVLARGIIGNHMVSIHQFLVIVGALISLSGISLLIMLHEDPSIIPFLVYDESSQAFTDIGMPISMEMIKLVIVLIIVLSILSCFGDFYHAGKLSKYK